MRIAFLSNINISIISKSLSKSHEVFEMDGYGTWVSYALQRDEKLSQFNPEMIVLLLDGNTLFPETGESRFEELNRTMTIVERLLEKYDRSYFAINSIDIHFPISNLDLEEETRKLCMKWESFIDELISNNPRCIRLNLVSLIEEIGRKSFYSSKMWYLGLIPYSMMGTNALVGEVEKIISRVTVPRKKVFIVDLDNTIWGGVVGEDGPQGIIIGNDNKGLIFKDVQRRILRIKESGILLAAISKNNINDVEQVFETNKFLVLKRKDFVNIIANWDSKSSNISLLASQLNLGEDSFVFLDDNPVEREEVRINNPAVEVVDFPDDITDLPGCIQKIYDDFFFSYSKTKEDLRKTDLYREDIQRKKALSDIGDMDNFLDSLKIRISMEHMKDSARVRVVQLLNKTNQFNTCTMRMDDIGLNEYLSNHGEVITFDVSDRFGECGLVGVICCHVNESVAYIDNFAMSCRVMGREIEKDVINSLFNHFSSRNISNVVAKYIPSAKNEPAKGLWSKLELKKIQTDSEEDLYEGIIENHTELRYELEWK